MSPTGYSLLPMLVALRATNTPIQTIAAALNRSPKAIHSLIKKHNLPRWAGVGPRVHPQERVNQVLHLRAQGHSYTHIAKALSLRVYQVTGIVRRAMAKFPA